MAQDGRQLFREETEWYNEILLDAVVPGDWWRGLPHPLQSWLRNCVGTYLLYFATGFPMVLRHLLLEAASLLPRGYERPSLPPPLNPVYFAPSILFHVLIVVPVLFCSTT
jgi:hypothetical protein